MRLPYEIAILNKSSYIESEDGAVIIDRKVNVILKSWIR